VDELPVLGRQAKLETLITRGRWPAPRKLRRNEVESVA
jgi:hypothetical protein